MSHNPIPSSYPARERRTIFFLLIAATGFFGAYTYLTRGGIFANAQTVNFVLLGIRLAEGRWLDALRLLLPITAFFLGTLLSQWLDHGKLFQKRLSFPSFLVLLEALAAIAIAFLPKTVPDVAVQALISFLSAMLFNTFRQNEGIPMATTFVTAHFRESSAALLFTKRDPSSRRRFFLHSLMIVFFTLGAFTAAFTIKQLDTYALIATAPLFLVAFFLLVFGEKKKQHKKDP